ncbi:MAG: glycoside hydrolase family 65 protein, partial [Planctomycetota bacterium]|nr:glycoside hydrolase family 65 protein [Planctomycetota bacterium]
PAATERTALLLRLHVFHLLQTASLHTTDLDVGVPARGWHGEAYRGHVFWDELFIFPLLNWRLPEVTRALLLYRYRRLDEARALARAEGLEGALFPWQSGSDGREETQRVHLNPRSGRWVPDETHLQRHVNAAVAYNVWEYYQVTGDVDFLAYHGAEMLLEIARLWSSLAALDPGTGRYSIAGVVGPDEFHTRLPGAAAPGLRDNAYTNVMAVWTLCRAREALDLLSHERRDDLREAIGLRDEELARWDDISRRMRVVFHEDGVISQFDGYERLEELDWGAYRAKYGDIHRLDRILEAEDDTPNRYKVSKQADVLMLFYLLSATRLRELFERLGYAFDLEVIPRTIDYYARRTSHGSTLSRVVDAWVLSRVDRPRSWRLFQEALESDVADIQGGTTAEGIHLGAMSGTVDLVQRCYTGIVTRDDVVWFDPRLPDELRCLRMTIVYRGLTLDLRFTHEALEVQARPSNARPIRIGVRGGLHDLCAGEARRFGLR